MTRPMTMLHTFKARVSSLPPSPHHDGVPLEIHVPNRPHRRLRCRGGSTTTTPKDAKSGKDNNKDNSRRLASPRKPTTARTAVDTTNNTTTIASTPSRPMPKCHYPTQDLSHVLSSHSMEIDLHRYPGLDEAKALLSCEFSIPEGANEDAVHHACFEIPGTTTARTHHTPGPSQPPPEEILGSDTASPTTHLEEEQEPQLEVQPGVLKRLRGDAQDTLTAFYQDQCIEVMCCACHTQFASREDCEWVVCPTCQAISPVEGCLVKGWVCMGIEFEYEEEDDDDDTSNDVTEEENENHGKSQ